MITGYFLFRMAVIAFASAGAWLVLARAHPVVRRPWPRAIFIAGASVSILAWVLPVALGRGWFGTVPVVGVPLRLLAMAWFLSAALTSAVGLPWLVVARVVARRGRPAENAPADPARRDLLMRVGRALPLAGTLGAVGGMGVGARRFVLRTEEFRIPGLPPELDGFRIGQITDVHLGPFIDTDDLTRVVAALDRAGVHLLVMTGDLIDDRAQFARALAILRGTLAPHGVLSVPGNHEHYIGFNRVRRVFSEAALPLLIDGSAVVEHHGARLRVVGVDYPMGESRDEAMAHSAERAFREVQPGETVLCLSHHPDFLPFAARRGAALVLSGHTHGGHVALAGVSPVSALLPRVHGRYTEGGCQQYVCAGAGHYLPFRVGMPREAAVVVLRRA